VEGMSRNGGIMKVELCKAECQHLQNDKSEYYYYLKLDGVIFQTPECCYPGNKYMEALAKDLAEKL